MTMQISETIASLRELVDSYSQQLCDVPDEAFRLKPGDGKWSKIEELGHLLDSAHSNLRRFVVGQTEDKPNIVYDQEAWVKACNYREQESGQLILLWTLLNEQICIVLENMPAASLKRECNTGKSKTELHTLEWLAADYVTHQLHHLHHILQLEAIPY
jgi:hypothetical protein